MAPTFYQIQEAKKLLESAGYFTENLWQVLDVQSKFNCTEQQAQKILSEALQNDATMEQIWSAIEFHGEEKNLILKNN